MKTTRSLRLLVLACIALISGPSRSEAQVATLLAGATSAATAGAVLDQAEEIVLGIIESAGLEADLALQKAAAEALLTLQTLEQLLQGQQDQAWSGVDQSIRNAFSNVDESLSRAGGIATELEELAFLDVTRVLDRVITGGAPLRRIEGAGQAWNEKADYGFQLIGAGVNPGTPILVHIGELELDPITPTEANRVAFSVPANQLEQYFQDDRVSSVPLRLRLATPRPLLQRILPWHWFSPNRLWDYDLRVQLFPRRPVVGFTLLELRSETVWGEPGWTDWGPEVRVRKAGRDCKRHQRCANQRTVSVQFPAGARPVLKAGKPEISGQVAGGCDTWCAWTDGPWVSGNRVNKKFKNWRKSYDADVRIRARYQLARDTITARAVQVTSTGDPGTAATDLEFGRIYSAELSQEYQSYELILSLFNGQNLQVTPSLEAQAGDFWVSHEVERLPNGQRLLRFGLLGR